MALLLCPDCENEASDRASVCPHCGFPIAASVVDATYARDREPRVSGGFVSGVILLGSVVLAIVLSTGSDAGATSPGNAGEAVRGQKAPTRPAPPSSLRPLGPFGSLSPLDRQVRQRPRVLEAVSAAPPERIHDYALAQRGHALHQQLMVEHDLDPEVYRPVLFGSATEAPRAAIYVSTAAWEACEARERTELAHYVASLVRAHWSAPEVFAGYSAADPNAALFRENAARMTADSWVILGGELDGEDGARAALRSGKVLVSGDEWRLSPSD